MSNEKVPTPVDTLPAFNREDLWQYFPNRTREKRQPGLVINLHAILASRAWLNNYTSRNPKPPSLFGNVAGSVS
ncbi:unnamed protein product [Brassica oleracea var. botrytis]